MYNIYLFAQVSLNFTRGVEISAGVWGKQPGKMRYQWLKWEVSSFELRKRMALGRPSGLLGVTNYRVNISVIDTSFTLEEICLPSLGIDIASCTQPGQPCQPWDRTPTQI